MGHPGVLQRRQGRHELVSLGLVMRALWRPGADERGRFASGKGSALVLDIGDELASVVPIYDGFVLRKGTLGC